MNYKAFLMSFAEMRPTTRYCEHFENEIKNAKHILEY